MVKIIIDNISYEAADGTTVLTVARSAGLEVPTLCFLDGLPHYSSCMVCMVKDKKKNSYIPSCSALVQDGMEIDASSDDVIALRKKSLELLFSEHRAECEAPCHIVCPAGYNIPLFNRLVSDGNFDKAISLTADEIAGKPIMCARCPGYCENACRRKKIDLPVSIRNMKLFFAAEIKGAVPETDDPVLLEPIPKTGRKEKRFNSMIGRLEGGEQEEWLKECANEVKRSHIITDRPAASMEAGSCMHCDCRASESCQLRELAVKMNLKDPKGKLLNAPIRKKINSNTGLIFENAKCIKCGLCVRVCEDDGSDVQLCFVNRGFISIISEPLTADFNDILEEQAKKVIEVCPTGALRRLK